MRMDGKPLYGLLYRTWQEQDIPLGAQLGQHPLQQAGGRQLVFDDGGPYLLSAPGVCLNIIHTTTELLQ